MRNYYQTDRHPHQADRSAPKDIAPNFHQNPSINFKDRPYQHLEKRGPSPEFFDTKFGGKRPAQEYPSVIRENFVTTGKTTTFDDTAFKHFPKINFNPNIKPQQAMIDPMKAKPNNDGMVTNLKSELQNLKQ